MNRASLNQKLFNKPTNNLNTTLGFTLVEIMVVVGLLLIFSLGSIANFITSQKNARDAKRKTDLGILSQTLEIYRGSISPPFYPSGNMLNIKTLLTSGGYISSDAFPQDPLSENGYVYYYSRPTDSTYNLCAYLEKKKSTDPNCPAGTPSCGGGKNCNYGITQPLP